MNNQIDLNTLMGYMVMIMMIGMMMRVMTRELKPAVERPLVYGPRGEVLTHSSEVRRLGKPRSEEERAGVHKEFYGTKELPPRGTGLEERHSIHGPERKRLVDQYGTWAVGRAESVCPEDDVECVGREASRLLGAYRRGFTE